MAGAEAQKIDLLERTPLYNLHLELGGKMVPFAGYEMPVQYPAGVIKEHLHTRTHAGLFDISHMGQIVATGDATILKQLERLMPGDFQELVPGEVRYSFLLNEQGGTCDDLMVTRSVAANEQHLAYIVVNASCKHADLQRLQRGLPDVKSELLEDRALLALQGPTAADVLSRFCDAPKTLTFMRAGKFNVPQVGECWISRSGYTGEDGFEISVPFTTVEAFTRQLLAVDGVMMIGLGARDSLRLEAGLSLYGHELTEEITPIEAGLTWAIGKRRRAEGGFVGAAKIQAHLQDGVSKKRIALRPEGRVVAREQTPILDMDGNVIGLVSSGTFGPSVNGPVALGFVPPSFAKPGTGLQLQVRGKNHPATVVNLPFTPHRYLRS